MTDRRNFLRKAAIGGGLTAFAAGFATTGVRMAEHALGQDAPNDRLHGNSLKPEFRIDPASGRLEPDPGQQVSYTACLGCTTQCSTTTNTSNDSQSVESAPQQDNTPQQDTADQSSADDTASADSGEDIPWAD